MIQQRLLSKPQCIQLRVRYPTQILSEELAFLIYIFTASIYLQRCHTQKGLSGLIQNASNVLSEGFFLSCFGEQIRFAVLTTEPISYIFIR